MSSVNTSGSFFEESTFGKNFANCLILGGLWDGKPWSQLLLYPTFVQTLIRSHQYSEIAVIACDGDFRIFRRLLQLFVEEVREADNEEGPDSDQQPDLVSKYKEYLSVDAFIQDYQSRHGDSAAAPSVALFLSQFSDAVLDCAFPSSTATSNELTSLPFLFRQLQQLPRSLGHAPSSSSSSSSAASAAASTTVKGPTRKLHIFTSICTSLHPPATVDVLKGLFPTVVHIRPNEGTFYASTVAAEVHTVRRADLTQKITENTELFVFGPWLPLEKQPGSHVTNKTAKKASSGSTISNTSAAAAAASSTASSLLFLWPLVVPPTSSDSGSSASAADSTQQPSSSVESTNPPTTVSSMGTKRLITFDRSDPEFDEDDDPDADLDL